MLEHTQVQEGKEGGGRRWRERGRRGGEKGDGIGKEGRGRREGEDG